MKNKKVLVITLSTAITANIISITAFAKGNDIANKNTLTIEKPTNMELKARNDLKKDMSLINEIRKNLIGSDEKGTAKNKEEQEKELKRFKQSKVDIMSQIRMIKNSDEELRSKIIKEIQKTKENINVIKQNSDALSKEQLQSIQTQLEKIKADKDNIISYNNAMKEANDNIKGWQKNGIKGQDFNEIIQKLQKMIDTDTEKNKAMQTLYDDLDALIKCMEAK